MKSRAGKNPQSRIEKNPSLVRLNLALIGFCAISLFIVWFLPSVFGFISGFLSSVTLSGVVISVLSGILTFGYGLKIYNQMLEIENKRKGNMFDDSHSYRDRKEAWKDHINEKEKQEKIEKELQFNGGSDGK